MHYDRRSADTRRFAHSEEILKPRFDPWRFSGVVMNLHFASTRKFQSFRRELIDPRRTQRRENIRNFGKAGFVSAELSNAGGNVDLDARKRSPRQQLIERVPI